MEVLIFVIFALKHFFCSFLQLSSCILNETFLINHLLGSSIFCHQRVNHFVSSRQQHKKNNEIDNQERSRANMASLQFKGTPAPVLSLYFRTLILGAESRAPNPWSKLQPCYEKREILVNYYCTNMEVDSTNLSIRCDFSIFRYYFLLGSYNFQNHYRER